MNPLSSVPVPVCRWIRAPRDLADRTGTPVELPEHWCEQTLGQRGPDGMFVHPDQCTLARVCFEPVLA